jgi:hypothetical protein
MLDQDSVKIEVTKVLLRKALGATRVTLGQALSLGADYWASVDEPKIAKLVRIINESKET